MSNGFHYFKNNLNNCSGVPHTLATFVSTCSVTSLDWIPNSDRHFVYGTSNGTVRLCDADERKVVTEMSASRENGAGQSVQQVFNCQPDFLFV